MSWLVPGRSDFLWLTVVVKATDETKVHEKKERGKEPLINCIDGEVHKLVV